MNLAIYDSLLPCIAGNDVVFERLLKYIPYAMPEGPEQVLVKDLLWTLLQKHLLLQDRLQRLEANLIPVSEEGSVTVIVPETIDGLNIVEQLLRETLAEVILTRGEMELAAAAKIVADCEDALDEDDALYAAKAVVTKLGKPYGCGSGTLVDLCFKCHTNCAHREDLLNPDDVPDDVPEIDVDGFHIDFPRT